MKNEQLFLDRDSFYDLGIIPLLTIRVANYRLAKERKFDVTSNVSDLWGLKYAYLGQVAYHHSVIAVAVKGKLVEQILCENWT